MAQGTIQHYVLTGLDANGTPTSTQGIVTDVDLGELEFAFDNDKRAGAYGVVSRRLTPDEYEVTFSTVGMTQELHNLLVGGVNSEISFQLSAIDEDTETGAIIPIKIVMRGAVSSIPFGSYTPQNNSNWDIGFMVNYIDRKWGDSTFIYDPRNFIWSINGKNLLADRKAALGV